MNLGVRCMALPVDQNALLDMKSSEREIDQRRP